MNKEEIKRNLENYILQTNGKTYLTFETNTNLMARDCLNTIEQLISQLDIANKKLDKINKFMQETAKAEAEHGFFDGAEAHVFAQLQSIIGGE